MNNSNLPIQNRIVQRKNDKVKRKVLVHLIGKGKVDKRTYRNLREIFSFIGKREQFTGPEIQRNKRLRGSILYDLIDALEERGLIVEVGKRKSAGRGETTVYGLTIAGKIVASYVNEDAELLVETLKAVAEKEANPLKRFFLNAFITNYPNPLMHEILEISISRVKELEEGFDIGDFIYTIFEDAFVMLPFFATEEKGKELKELVQIFRKNAELMEKEPNRDWIFLSFKMQLESNYLFTLEGEKLQKYAESLKENPQLLHIPCDNPECNNVIVVDSLLKMSIPQYCEKCKNKEGVKP